MTEPLEKAYDSNEKTISTDSEESFLMKQLNNSELFNNSNNSSLPSNQSKARSNNRVSKTLSSSSSSSQGGRINLISRRSFFRESFIDDNGEDRPFTVFEDAINASNDSSRDITGIDELDTNILAELDVNASTISLGKNDSKRNPCNSKRSSNRSSKSFINQLDLSDISDDSVQARDFVSSSSKLEGKRVTSEFKPRLIAITTPRSESPQPLPQPLPQPGPGISSLHQHKSSTSSSNYLSVDSKTPPITQAPTFVPPALPKVQAAQYFRTEKLQSVDDFKDPNHALRDSHRVTSTNTLRSASDIQSIHESIQNFEETRNKVSNKEFYQNHKALHSNSHIRPSITKHDTLADIGMAPSIVETPLDLKFPREVHFSDKEEPLTEEQHRSLIIQHYQKAQNQSKSPQPNHGFIEDEKVEIDDFDYIPKSSQFFDPTEVLKHDLMEKIIDSRNTTNTRNVVSSNANFIAWMIYLFSFVIPPMFFLLGLGLMDQFAGNIDRSIKTVSLLTGVVYSMAIIVCIGVGFGVGLRNYQ